MLLLSWLGCSSAPDQKVVVLGIDGLEWSMVDRLELENLGHLREIGVRGTVATTTPVMSPIIWTSYASGYAGDVHGIAGWTDGKGHGYSSADVRTMRIWDVATAHDRTSLVVGWLMSFPSSPIQGRMLSDSYVWSFPMNKDPDDPSLEITLDKRKDMAGLASPPDFDPAELLPSEDWLAEHDLAYQVSEYGSPFHPLRRDEMHIRVFEQEWAKGDADLGLVYINGPDQVSHLYWPYADPPVAKMMELEPQLHLKQARSEMAESGARRAVPFSDGPITRAELELGGRFVPDYYRAVDEMVGRVLDVVDLSDTTLLVVSDHGFRNGTRRPLISGGHSREGAVLWAGAGVDPSASIPEGTVLDIGPTLFALAGLPGAADWTGTAQLEVFPDVDVPDPVDSWVLADRGSVAREAAAEANPQLMHQLEALGYVDGSGKPILGASRGLDAPE